MDVAARTKTNNLHGRGISKILFLCLAVSIVMVGVFCSVSEEDELQFEEVGELRVGSSHKVDILFVIDNSNSMEEEQEVLTRQFEFMARELISPTLGGPGGIPPVDDLHIGVVSTDMGTHGYTIMTCNESENGDRGFLQSVGRVEGCSPSYTASDCGTGECPWLSHSLEHPDDGFDPSNPPIWEDFGCIAALGTRGCGFEQPLEASLSALTTQAEDDRPNEGFLRSDSILIVIYIADEDDCSTRNGEIFNPSAEEFGPMNTRCAMNPDELHPIERYHDGLLALRPGREEMVIVAAIAAFPIDGSWNPGDPLEELQALQQINPSNVNELWPVCQTGMGLAFPSARIAELVYSFGNNGVLGSCCRNDWTAYFQSITRKIQDVMTSSTPCLSRGLSPLATEMCRLVGTLDGDQECSHLADSPDSERTVGWHRDLGLDEEGNRRCEVLLSDYDNDGCPDGATTEQCSGDDFGGDSGALQGWFVRHDNPNCSYGYIDLTSDDVLNVSGTLRLECNADFLHSTFGCNEDMTAVIQCPESGECTETEICAEGAVCNSHEWPVACSNPCDVVDITNGRLCWIHDLITCSEGEMVAREGCETSCRQGACQSDVIRCDFDDWYCPDLRCGDREMDVSVCLNGYCLTDAWSGSEYCE